MERSRSQLGGHSQCMVCMQSDIVYQICQACGWQVCLQCIFSLARTRDDVRCPCRSLENPAVYPTDIQAAIAKYKTDGQHFLVMGPLTAEDTQTIQSITAERQRVDRLNHKYQCPLIICSFIGIICAAITMFKMPIVVQIIIACLLFAHLCAVSCPCVIYTLDLTYLIYTLCVTQQPVIIAMACIAIAAATATICIWRRHTPYSFDPQIEV